MHASHTVHVWCVCMYVYTWMHTWWPFLILSIQVCMTKTFLVNSAQAAPPLFYSHHSRPVGRHSAACTPPTSSSLLAPQTGPWFFSPKEPAVSVESPLWHDAQPCTLLLLSPSAVPPVKGERRRKLGNEWSSHICCLGEVIHALPKHTYVCVPANYVWQVICSKIMYVCLMPFALVSPVVSQQSRVSSLGHPPHQGNSPILQWQGTPEGTCGRKW